MTTEKSQEAKWISETPTETLEFAKWGKWTVRGLLAEEDFQIQDRYMTVDARTGKTSIDTTGMRIETIQAGVLESPHGAKPPTNVLRKIPAGMANRLLDAIKKLGTPGEVVEKN